MAFIKSAAHRRYVIRLGVATALYLVSLAAALRLVGDGHVRGVAAYVLATLPGLAIVGMFWSIGRLIVEETDEYQKMLLVRQTLVATAFSLSIASVWGFLENLRLAPHVDSFFIAILWFGGLGVGSLYNRLTLGDGGGCA